MNKGRKVERRGLKVETRTLMRVSLHVYLRDEDAGYALRVVPFRVWWSKQLLTFPLLKAVEEGWIQDVLQHLSARKKETQDIPEEFLVCNLHYFSISKNRWFH